MEDNNKKGFTLIEILIVIVILSIMALVVGFAYITFLTHTNVNSTNQEIYSIIKSAQDDSLNNLDGYQNYGVYFSSTSVTLFQGDSYSQTDATNKVYNFPPSVYISNINPASNNPIVFASQTGQLTNSGISFVLGNISYSINVNININGAVY
jgi:prepilin-type N-terminal cleavage/methylation domain-containing protein